MSGLFAHPSENADFAFDQSGWTGSGDGARNVYTRSLEVSACGTYRLKVTLSAPAPLFGQRRNLIETGENAETDIEFLSVLTEYIPSMSSVPDASLKLYASAFGAEILKLSAEKIDARRVFVAGDSTVADQYAGRAYYPCDSYCGWGQFLSAFLRDDALCNMAHSGLTGRCFIEDGHFDIVKKYMRPGDLILIQFGHNDQKRRYLQADKQYTGYLSRIVSASVELGGKPLLITPLSRVPVRDAAGYFDLLLAHAEAVKNTALRLNVPCIDLHEYSFKLFCGMGDACRELFMDQTHLNDPGAFVIAGFIARGLEKLRLAHVSALSCGFLGSDKLKNPRRSAPRALPVPYVDTADVPDKSIVFRGVQAGLLDPCVLHMHPFEPVSRAQFIQMLFRARSIPTAPTDGKAPYRDVGAREFDSAFAAACRLRGLVPGDYYRPDEMISAAEVNELCEKLNLSSRLSDNSRLPDKYSLVELLLRARLEKRGS